MSRQISISDEVYNNVQKVSERLGLAPEEFVTEATEAMLLRSLSDEEVEARIAAVCATEDTSMDPIIEQLQGEAIGKEEW